VSLRRRETFLLANLTTFALSRAAHGDAKSEDVRPMCPRCVSLFMKLAFRNVLKIAGSLQVRLTTAPLFQRARVHVCEAICFCLHLGQGSTRSNLHFV
jgi:hypothetical protein